MPTPRSFTRTETLDDDQIEEIVKFKRAEHECMPFEEHVVIFTISSTLLDETHEDTSRELTLTSTIRTVIWRITGEVETHDEIHVLRAHLSTTSYLKLWVDDSRRSPRNETIADALPPGLFHLNHQTFETMVTRRFAKIIDAQRPSRLLTEWIDANPTTVGAISAEKTNLDVEELRDLLAEDYRLYYVKAHPDVLDAFAEESDIKALSERLFACSRKDLVKALVSTELTFVNIGYVLYDASMPIDALVHFLTTCDPELPEPMLADVSMLAEFSLTSRHKILKNWRPERDAMALVDLVAMIVNGPDTTAPTKEVKHLAEAESHMVALANTRYRERVRQDAQRRRDLDQRRAAWLLTPAGVAWTQEQDELERRRLAEIERLAAEAEETLRREHAHRVEVYANLRLALDDFVHTTADGERLTIEVARSPETLRGWGHHLGTNCIGNGGYDQYITSLKAMLVGIHHGDVHPDGRSVVYTADIRISDHPNESTKLIQFRGYNNQMPKDDQWFDDLLADLGVVITRK